MFVSSIHEVFQSNGIDHLNCWLLALKLKSPYSIVIRYYGSVIRLTPIIDTLSKDISYTEPRIKLGNVLICKYVAYIINTKDLYPKMIYGRLLGREGLGC